MEILSLLCRGLRLFSVSRPNVSGIGRFDVNHPEPCMEYFDGHRISTDYQQSATFGLLYL